ncbi:TonB-dependent receptor [Sphingobium sp. DEHP117]|uniref:TonB-dependent receptor n=1 Tax=Sphingobium sp. DEHP117 TaxID=2993436 RepID=UPI0027D66A80|nr:TonB-dependent receptor [Sphingobium sp. DEHP117]MDQ4420371.1 TonB-dependent receptor [Sphingobium sp. DEHP117]
MDDSRKAAGAALMAVLCVAPLSVMPAAAQSEQGSGDGEIIVTARKQQESVLRVPVVEQVLTADAIERFQIRDVQDISTRIPGLASGSTIGSIGEQMSLRGVGSNSLDQGVDQSVSLVIDGLQLTHGLAFRAAAFDLQQVEVLKGPQALYFGKNTTAGLISFQTADPGKELEVKANASYEFETREKRGEFVISTPINETLGVRVAALYSNLDGDLKNIAFAQPRFGGKNPRYSRLGGGRSHLVRLTTLWKPTDNFTARLKANFTKDKFRYGSTLQLASCPDGTGPIGGAPWNFFSPAEDCKFDKKITIIDFDPAAFRGVRNNGVPFHTLRQNFGSLELNYDLSSQLSLTSLSGFYDAKGDASVNATSASYAAPAFLVDTRFRRREFTQELRLASDFDGPLNFTAGTFYQKGKISNDFLLLGNQSFLLSDLVPIFPAVPILPPELVKGKSTIDIDSISFFGQLRWQATDKLEIAAGARWQNERRKLHVLDRFTNTRVALKPGSDHIGSKNWSPELTLTYLATDDLTVFAAAKRAYKSGSFSIVVPGNPGEDKSFGDERVTGGEGGIKARLMDRALSLNVAGYYYRYDGLQTGVNELQKNGLPVVRTINAGKADIHGVDLELNYRPPAVEGLSLSLVANWNKTKFLKLNNVPCYGGQLISQGCTQQWAPAPDPTNAPGAILDPAGSGRIGYYTSQDLRGIPFVRAPEWRINFGFAYEAGLANGKRLIFANENQYSSSYITVVSDPATRPQVRQSEALKVDLSLTLYGSDDRWSVGLAGKNLTDKLRPGFCSTQHSAGAAAFSTLIAGGTTRNVGGEDELACSAALGRSVAVRIGFKY